MYSKLEKFIFGLFAVFFVVPTGLLIGIHVYKEFSLIKQLPNETYLKINEDISRICLQQCKDKAVESFGAVDGKLKCGCAK